MSSTKKPAIGSRYFPWDNLPKKIKTTIIDLVAKDDWPCGALATVSREFQMLIEPHTFQSITVTPARIAEFGKMTARNQHHVQNLWLSLELQPYICGDCLENDDEAVVLLLTATLAAARQECAIITNTIRWLFSHLQTWSLDRRQGKGLVLDISAHCTSDREHAFSYLTSEPYWRAGDAAWIDRHEAILRDNSPWVRQTGCEMRIVEWHQLHSCFREVFPVPLPANIREFWDDMPKVPLITTIMIRQQNRRRWSPGIIGRILSCCPNVQELIYEPWREWFPTRQYRADEDSNLLFESLPALRSLVIFENFNETYADAMRQRALRSLPTTPRRLVRASLGVEEFSASFLVEAAGFLRSSLESGCVWPNLTSFAMTSRLLTDDMPQGGSPRIQRLLWNAAAAARRMPNLRVMELWHGQEGRAVVFRYQPSAHDGGPASVVCRGTRATYLSDRVRQAWRDTAVHGRSAGVTFRQERLDGKLVTSHAAAISMLQLVSRVIQPISLQQTHQEIAMRQRLRVMGLET
ncbi:hypothetical protein CCM_02364 [Cordyceps militaris CM01]|uniref:DUF6546 domain-containing protein n=1 Tax=Cordyceps militaris (strain CM01) TaxID=983644 RepID=G3J9B4_CORMM|nr:uncharacterized protein CCM_02364 [Cordyceps militaris CM01]EGX94093.1 hypothetical protein CCM_02364 [Cordyceps militaris CM01]